MPLSYLRRLLGELKLGLSGKCNDGSYMDAISSMSSGLAKDMPDGSASSCSGIMLGLVIFEDGVEDDVVLDGLLATTGRGGGGNTPCNKNCLCNAFISSASSSSSASFLSNNSEMANLEREG